MGAEGHRWRRSRLGLLCWWLVHPRLRRRYRMGRVTVTRTAAGYCEWTLTGPFGRLARGSANTPQAALEQVCRVVVLRQVPRNADDSP